MFDPEPSIVEHLRGKMEGCGKKGIIMRCDSNPSHRAFIRGACDIWGCPQCSKHQFMKYKKRLEPRLLNAIQGQNGFRKHPLKFVTLTLPFFVKPILEDIEYYHRLAVAFLRSTYRGGLCVLEFSPRESDMIFLHFHAIVEGDYVAQSHLQDGWSEYVGKPAIVDVRKASADGLGYVLKYLTKGVSGFDSSEMLKIAATFYKRQRLRSFGTLRTPVEIPRLYASCPCCGSLMRYEEGVNEWWYEWYLKNQPEKIEGLDPPLWIDELEAERRLSEIFRQWHALNYGPAT